MSNRILAIRNRILAIAVMSVLILSQALLLMSINESNYSYASDGSLEVRIQYDGWRGDKIPVKASFSRSELKSIGNTTHRYTNVTDVATLLRIVAQGPKVTSVLDAAGIDRSSVKYIVFRTTDGNGKDGRYSMQLDPGKYEENRWYYPNLPKNYDRDNEEYVIRPHEGSLKGAVSVPAIIGVSYYSTKRDDIELSDSKLKDQDLLRLCLGQTKIRENEWTEGGYGGDVTSHQSVDLIYGMDVILKGSPIRGMELGLDNTDLKVGSSAQISVNVSGDEAFAGDYTASKMKWKSSDTSVATVDKNGVVTIVGPGTATITATAPDGTQASIVINGSGKREDAGGTTGGNDKDKGNNKNRPTKEVKIISAKELFLGDKIEVGTDEGQTIITDPDVWALGEAEDYGRGALYGTVVLAVAAYGAGFVLRIRKFKIDK